MSDQNNENGREEQRTRSFNPNEHLMKLKSKDGLKDYLPVKWRLVWFREQCPHGTIDNRRRRRTQTNISPGSPKLGQIAMESQIERVGVPPHRQTIRVQPMPLPLSSNWPACANFASISAGPNLKIQRR